MCIEVIVCNVSVVFFRHSVDVSAVIFINVTFNLCDTDIGIMTTMVL